MKIYHTETQEDYDALMVELEEQGCTWLSGRKPTSPDYWKQYGEKTGIEVGGSGLISKGVIEYLEEVNPQAEVIKYKAKADEKMKFTKENVSYLFREWKIDEIDTMQDLEREIIKLEAIPEKVAVPKFVAEFYEECANATLEFLITQLEATDSRSELGKWYRSCRGRHRNGRANAQEVIAKMKLYGYEVESDTVTEQRYTVVIADRYLVQLFIGRTDYRFVEFDELCAWKPNAFQLTEAEIKAIDERFWAFAVPAQEVKQDEL